MVSRLSKDDFGNDGASALDGVQLHTEIVEPKQEASQRKLERSNKAERSIVELVGDFGCAYIFVVAGIVYGAVQVAVLQERANTKYGLESACKLDPSLGTTHEYKTERPDGAAFPHAILKSSKKADPFIVFGGRDRPIHVFQDSNENEIVDGKETVQTFATPDEAQQFLTEAVQKINSAVQ